MSGRSRRIVSEVEEIATVASLTHDGEGVVREGKTAFVAGALPGERIRFRRTRRHRQHDEAELLEVLEPSASRVVPRCAHFGICGGCALQHLSAEAQLEAKQAELRDNLERMGKVSPREWLAPLRGPVWNYRRRARLGSKFVIKKDRVVVGFRERLAPYVAELQRCEVLAAPVGEMIAPLAAMLNGLSIRHRIPQIEAAVADNVVALVLRVLDSPSADDLMRLREFATAHSVRFYLQTGGLDSVSPLDGAAGEPQEALRYGLPDLDLKLEFTPTDFVQVNAQINQALVARAVELLELAPSSSVLDLYCGIGNFTLALARNSGRAVGVGLPQPRQSRLEGPCQVGNVKFGIADLIEARVVSSAVHESLVALHTHRAA